jgi:hypothetical protein
MDTNSSTAATVKFMHDAIDATQLALDNSTANYGQPGVQSIAQVAFLGAQEVSESDEGDAVAALTYVTNNSEPAAFRTFYGADVLMYVIEDGGTTLLGVSNGPYYNGTLPIPGHDFAMYAESVVQRNRAISDTSGTAPQYQEPYVFIHEFAHELGANHNVEANGNTTPLTPSAYGKWAPHLASEGGGQRTIMSYLNASCTAPCTRILNFSNPNVQEDWFTTGDSAANNALVLQTYADTTAQYCASLGRIFANAFEDRFHRP